MMNQNYDRIFILILFWKITARVLSEMYRSALKMSSVSSEHLLRQLH